MARPPITVDESRIVELAAKGHTLKGIAAILDISYKTLHRRFGPACEKGHELMRGELRAKQLEVALKGNPVMLIWLGKQELGQRDKQEMDIRKETTVQMVVSIAPEKIKALTDGYLQPQLPSEAESIITVEPENQQNGAESMPDEARGLGTKKSD